MAESKGLPSNNNNMKASPIRTSSHKKSTTSYSTSSSGTSSSGGGGGDVGDDACSRMIHRATSSSSSSCAGTRSPRSRLCSHPGCSKQVQQGGVCCRHGARTTRALCTDPSGCTNVAKRGGLCRRHGAFRLGTCGEAGCRRVARSGGHCDLHQPQTHGTRGGEGSSCSRGCAHDDDGIAADAQAALSSSPTCVMHYAHFDMGEYDTTTTSPMMSGLMYRTVSGETYEEMQGGCVAHAHGGNDNPPIDEEELDLDFLGDYYEDMY